MVPLKKYFTLKKVQNKSAFISITKELQKYKTAIKKNQPPLKSDTTYLTTKSTEDTCEK